MLRRRGVKQTATDGRPRSRPLVLTLPDPSELPDYPAPFVASSVRADHDGNLWILESATTLVYDVVNRDGALIDRVALPGKTAVEGFGAGVVYLSSRDGTGMSIVRVRIH